MKRLLAFVALLAGCPPSVTEPVPDGCAIRQVEVEFPSPDDVVEGFPAVNDETRLACRLQTDTYVICPLSFTATDDDCAAMADRVRDRLAHDEIAGDVSCLVQDQCTGVEERI